MSDGNRVSVRYQDQFLFQELVSPLMWVNLHLEFRDGLLLVLDDQYDTLLGKEFWKPWRLGLVDRLAKV